MTKKKPITQEQRVEVYRRSGPEPYQCPDCSELGVLDDFGVRRTPEGTCVRRSICRECQARRASEYQKAHPEVVARWARQWRRRLLKKLGAEGFRAWMQEKYETRVKAVGKEKMREYWRERYRARVERLGADEARRRWREAKRKVRRNEQ